MPQRLLEAGGRVGLDIQQAREQRKAPTLARVIGNSAAIAEPLLDIATLGGGTILKSVFKNTGKNVVKAGAKQTSKQILKQAVKRGAIEGGTTGLVFGGLRGLSEGNEADLKNFAVGAGAGLTLGGLLGGGAAGVSAFKHLIKRTPQVEKQLRDNAGKYVAGTKPTKPEGMPQPQWDFQLEFNQKYKRNPYTPVYSSDLTEAVKYETSKKGLGLSIRDVTKDKAPLSTSQAQSAIEDPLKDQILTQQPDAPRMSQKALQEGVTPQVGSTGGGTGAKPPTDDKYAFNINKQRLDMNDQQKASLDDVVTNLKPELEKIKGKPLSFEEVQVEAKKADLLDKTIGRDQTKNFEGSLLATRERMTTLNNEIDRMVQTGDTTNAERLTKELFEKISIVSSVAADAGRKLGSFRIKAKDRPFREQLIIDMQKTKKFTDAEYDKLIKESAKVNFNDPKQVEAFYKQFITPSIGKILEEYRYFNLLSSPKTHIVNTFSNAIQAGITKPVTKLVTGIVDPIASALTGKARENYISEVPAYYRGMFGAIPEAFSKVQKIFKGEADMTNLDFKELGRRPVKYNIVTKSMESMDVFFRSLIEGGEKEALGVKNTNMGGVFSADDINQLARQAGDYGVFRQGLHTRGQGVVLDWIDKGTEAVLGLRRVPGVSWFIPFVQTPMNILKQGVEYSPLGFSTMIKADNKTEQFSKAIIGSMVFTGAGALAMQDRLTWQAPTDLEQKKNFYASGMQPYSVKVGDKWVSYSKIGPLAYPLAMAAAIKYRFKDDPNAAANDDFEKLSNSLMGVVGFFGDQSYMQGIGNIVGLTEGKEGYNLTKIISSVPAQYVPAASFQRWVNSIIDPIYRKPETFVDNMKNNLIAQTGGLDYYENPLGEPSKRQFPIENAFNPMNTTQENPEFKEMYDLRQFELQQNAINREIDRQAEKDMRVGLNPAEAAEGDSKIDALRAKALEKTARTRVEATGKRQIVGSDVIYQNENGTTSAFDMSRSREIAAMAEDNKYTKAVKQSAAYTHAQKILELPEDALSEKEKYSLIEKMGITADDVKYLQVANDNVSLKTLYVLDKVSSKTGDELMQELISYRKTVNDKQVLSNDVIDNLVDEGLIDKGTAKELKKIKLDESGKPIQAALSGSGKGGSGKKKAKALLNFQKQQALALSKLFQSQVKNEKQNNARNLEKVLQKRSPSNTGLSRIQSILTQSEEMVKKKPLKAILTSKQA